MGCLHSSIRGVCCLGIPYQLGSNLALSWLRLCRGGFNHLPCHWRTGTTYLEREARYLQCTPRKAEICSFRRTGNMGEGDRMAVQQSYSQKDSSLPSILHDLGQLRQLARLDPSRLRQLLVLQDLAKFQLCQ